MDNSKQSKQVLLSVIGVAILVVAVVGVSFAFFNYTRSGQQNSVGTGKIWFVSTQSGALEIENFFPQRPGSQDTLNTSTATITITGGTTYLGPAGDGVNGGLTYRLRAVNVKRNGVAYDPTAEGNVPILLDVTGDNTATGVNGTHGTFTASTGTGTGGGVGTGIKLAENAILGTGTITGRAGAEEDDVDGTITVVAYIDSNVAITDTYPEGSLDSNPTGYVDGTTDAWLQNRTRLTTAQWNALGEYPVTFRILVEAIENGGAYVDGTFPRS